ncbi:MAG: SH3 domain-containing protein, partial [Pseudomonadota bacterium]
TKAAFVSDDVAEQVAEAVQAEVEEIQTELQEKIVLYVTGSSVNVRAGPSTQNAVLGRVRRGDEVELVDYEDNGWAKIRVADLANEVFISGDYLSDTR